MTDALPSAALDQLFRSARTYNAFSGEISDETLRQLYDLVKWGPTSANMSPARFVFVKSKAAKARLEPALSGAVERFRAFPARAPATRLDALDTLAKIYAQVERNA